MWVWNRLGDLFYYFSLFIINLVIIILTWVFWMYMLLVKSHSSLIMIAYYFTHWSAHKELNISDNICLDSFLHCVRVCFKEKNKLGKWICVKMYEVCLLLELSVFFNLESRWTNLQRFMFQILYWVFKMHFINVNFITIYSVLCKKCYVWFYTSRSLRCKYLYISAPDLYSVALLLGLNWNINEANIDISFIIELFQFFTFCILCSPHHHPFRNWQFLSSCLILTL